MSKLLKEYNELLLINNKNKAELALELALNNLLIKIYEINEKNFIKYYDNTIKILEEDLTKIKNKQEINLNAYNHTIELLLYLNEISEIKVLENINKLKALGHNFSGTITNIETTLNESTNSILCKSFDLKKMNEIVSILLLIRTK